VREDASTPRDPRKSLFDILEACRLIEEFTTGFTEQVFLTDRKTQSSVKHQFIILGEALRRLRDLDETLYEHVTDAARIIQFRNVLTHEYDVVSDDIVWNIIQEKLPLLAGECRALFEESM
jgi:uncharacterized protein with HEPN domain